VGLEDACTIEEMSDQVMPVPEPLDAGQELMRRLVGALQVPDHWSVHSSRSLTWWAHRLAQQVWVEPVSEIDGLPAVRVHAATDLLQGVAEGSATAERVSALNRFCSLSALVWDAPAGEVALHAAATIHPGNAAWLEPLFASTITLQVAEAHGQLEEWARHLEAQPAVSDHPTNGHRKEPDERLDVIETVFGKVGGSHSPFTGEDFLATLQMEGAPWTSASAMGVGFTADLPFLDLADSAGTAATITASAEARHPILGYGALVRLALPMHQGGAEMAARLNAAEAREATTAHMLGAWCKGQEGGVSFLTFLPAAAYEPGLLRLMALNAAERARWVKDYLSRPEPAAPLVEETPADE
jgi:hypothetical protein